MRARIAIAGVLVTVMTLAWAAPSGADTFRVRATGSESEGWDWTPMTRHLSKGDKVVWRNPTDKPHTVTAYGRGWSKNVRVDPGERTSKRFRRAGTYRYRCMTSGHSALNDGRCVGMCGKVRVH